MRRKMTFYTELSYLFGIVILAVGTALMERADFGMSMVVAPAYLLHLKVSQYWSFFSFGMAEYCLQAVLIVLLSLMVRRFKVTYLFSFVTAVFYGVVLDGAVWAVGWIPDGGTVMRVVFFVAGLLLGSLGVALLFRTYISPEAYELMVKELAARYGWDIHKVKTIYDCISCAVSVVLSFAFFGLWHFEGVKLGTILCALINGLIIGLIGKGLDTIFDFRDGFKLRHFFETK